MTTEPITYHSASGHHYAITTTAETMDEAARFVIAEWLALRLTWLECEELLDLIERETR